MDILKTATDWTRADVMSSWVFVLFGLAFVAASFGFWQLGRTEMARAYVIPGLVAGVLLLVLGGGLLYGAQKTLAGLEPAFTSDARAFVAAEMARVDKTLADYSFAVFKVMPLIVAVSAILMMVLHGPGWRAGLITTMLFIGVIMLVDTNANARLQAYKGQLAKAAEPG